MVALSPLKHLQDEISIKVTNLEGRTKEESPIDEILGSLGENVLLLGITVKSIVECESPLCPNDNLGLCVRDSQTWLLKFCTLLHGQRPHPAKSNSMLPDL